MPSFESSIKAKKTKNPNKYKRWRPSVSNSVGLMTLDKPLPGCKGHVKQLLRTNDKTLMKTAFPVATCQLCLHELTSVSSFALAISFSLTCTTRYTSLRISLLQDITSLRRNSATRNRNEPLQVMYHEMNSIKASIVKALSIAHSHSSFWNIKRLEAIPLLLNATLFYRNYFPLPQPFRLVFLPGYNSLESYIFMKGEGGMGRNIRRCQAQNKRYCPSPNLHFSNTLNNQSLHLNLQTNRKRLWRWTRKSIL